MKKLLLILIAMLLLTARPAVATVVSDFNTGLCDPDPDPQCWTVAAGFTLHGYLSGGNPDGYAQLTDNGPGGDGGLAVAPPKFLGDLTGYASISWDALLPSNYETFAGIEPVILVISSSTTDYSYLLDWSSGVADVWQHWQAPLDVDTGWSCTSTPSSCSTPFADVLANVTRLAFDLEVTSSVSLEAGLDNVRLNPIPVPPAVWLFGSGLLGLVGIARRRQR